MTCTACPLHEHALTICVGARGAESASILIVGQNPGASEDLAGEAFVGSSGKLLDAMLADAGIDSATVRRSNAVRCITPDNRAPTPAEMSACLPHLQEEIDRVRPQVIVALGEVALHALVGPRAISAVRGQELDLHPKRFTGHRCPVYATWRPAYVLRTPQARNVVVTDLRRVRDRNMPRDEIAWQPYRPDDPWRIAPVLAYDIETYDEQGAILDTPTQVAVAVVGHPVCVSARNKDHLLRQIKHFAAEVVSHNGWAFDDLRTGVHSQWDTRVMAYLDDETQPLNLESLCVKYLGVRGWKEDRGNAVLGSRELVEYNARDAAYTLRLFVALKSRLTSKQLLILEEILRPARRALTDMSATGVFIDGDAVAQEQVSAEAAIIAARAEIDAQLAACGFPDDAFDVQLKTKVRRTCFNPNSGAHIAAVLRHLGNALPYTHKSGKERTDAETLARIDHPFTRAVETYREIAKRKSTYIDTYARIAATGDGRAHATFKLATTVTGRTACERPNLQNLDRTLKRFKSAPPGRVLTEADYAGVEFRMGAWIAQESTIIGNYAKNASWDPHAYVATILYGVTLQEILDEPKSPNSRRQIAKSANFSQVFMGDDVTLRNYALREMGIALSVEDARRIHRSWHQTFPDWRPWYERVWNELVANKGHVEGMTGQRRHIGDLSLLNKHQQLEAWRECVNFKVQNFCAHLAQLSLRFCHEAALPLVDHVHDSNSFEFASPEQAQQAEPLIRRCMIDEPLRLLRRQFGCSPTVPLEVEITHRQGALARQTTGV
ncbi:MAG: hypothetical protein KGL39_09155 [Patescibacteria group bacterium]|nr:hypothetical protein [Patescibacteria group bacterium]